MLNSDLASPRADGNFYFEHGLMEFLISCVVRGKKRLENNLTKLMSSYFRRPKEGTLGCLRAAQGTSSLDWILKGEQPRDDQVVPGPAAGQGVRRARAEQGQGLWAEVTGQTLAERTSEAQLPGPLGQQLAGDTTCLCSSQLWSGLHPPGHSR